MTIDQMDVFDIIANSESGSEMRLPIVDHLSWDVDEAEHLWLLQCKINKYRESRALREVANGDRQAHCYRNCSKIPFERERACFGREIPGAHPLFRF